MGTYRPLFSLEVEHRYFESGYCPVLSYVPTPESAAIMKNTGLALQYLSNGVAVYYDNANQALPLYAEDSETPLSLAFKVFSNDPYFSVYTALDAPDDASLLYFDNTQGSANTETRTRLHAREFVSRADYIGFSSPTLAPLLSERDRLIRPVCIVNTVISSSGSKTPNKGLKFPPKHYYLTFEARQTIWKYYLLGAMAKTHAYIADVNDETEFVFAGETQLPGNRHALAYRSKAAIALRQKAESRFQLKARAPGGDNDTVLIKQLATASPSQISKEKIDGQVVDVSEIYINC